MSYTSDLLNYNLTHSVHLSNTLLPRLSYALLQIDPSYYLRDSHVRQLFDHFVNDPEML
jgi:hypothetical protein